ncbi:alpha/beta fold hydrolase [bacterium]|nr:alpha/beta fold hydrolase [bacterium]
MNVSSPIAPRHTPAVPSNRQPVPPRQDPQENPLDADDFAFHFCSTCPDHPSDTPLELPAEDAPRLSKPVLLVHGFNSEPGTWKNMHDWLVRGGANKDGGVVKGSGGTVDPNAKVFAMEFARPFNPVSNNAAELRQAIDRITQATGSAEVDVIGHSMGGLDTRLYLDQGDEKVDKLLMIATPNHGSVLADLELSFRGMGIEMVPPTDDPLVRQALRDCSEERGDNNPLLTQLNKNLPRQASRAKILTLAGNGKPTMSSRYTVTVKGDAVVTQASVTLPNIPLRNLWGVDHGQVKDHPDALRIAGAFLSGAPLPMQQEEPPNLPPDREIVPRKISADKDHIHYFTEN